MKSKIFAVGSIVCILALAISFHIVSRINDRVPKNPSGTVGNTSGNLYNGGIFCENDGYVYFANAYDNNALYRMRPDESEMTRLIASQTASINADGKYLYYYQQGSGSGTGLGYVINTTGIYRAEKENPRKLACLDRIFGKNVVLIDNALYYSCIENDATTNKIDIDGENKEVVFDFDVLPTCVYDSTLYYANNKDDQHLMAFTPETGLTRQALIDDIYMPIVDGSSVYGIDVHNGYALVCVNLYNGTRTTLDTEWTDMLNVTDGNYIYYQTAGKTPQLTRIYKDGSHMEVVSEGAYNAIHVTSNFVYFNGFGSTIPVYKTPVNGAVNVTTFDAAATAAAAAMTPNKK